MKPSVRHATSEDIALFYPSLPYRVRAWAGVLGDEVIAVGGIGYPPDETHLAFFKADDKARGYPVALHKAGLMVLREAEQLGIRRLVTYAEPDIEAAERWLERLRFKKTMIDNERAVWIWQPG